MKIKDNKKDDFTLLDSNPLGQFVINKEFKVLFWNKCIENWTGINRKQIVNTSLFQYYPHIKEAKYSNRIEMVFKTAMPAVFSSVIHNHFMPSTIYGDVLRKQHITATCIPGKECDENYVLVSIQDVSNLMNSIVKLNREMDIRKKVEKNISKLSQAIKQSPALVIITDNNGKIEYVNPEFIKITGYSFDEVIGKTPRILKSGIQSDFVYAKLWETITAGGEWKGRLCNRKKNGELYWEYMCISGVRDETDTITNFVAVKIDETDRVNAEKEFCNSNRRFAKMLEVSEDAIVSIDEEQRILIFNKGAERAFGYTAEEIIGKSIFILIPARCRNQYKDHIEYFSRSETEAIRLSDSNYELFGLKKDDTEFQIDISVSKFEEAGSMIYTAVIRDITQRKKLECEALKAQKLESLGILAGGIAHDFNNVLTAILGNTELAMIQVINNAKVYKSMENVKKASLRAKELAQRLLTFSKGGLPVKKSASIAKLIRESTEFALMGSNVKSTINISDELWLVEVDEGQLNQVLNNLIVNAVQAMPKGGNIDVYAENRTKHDLDKVLHLNHDRYITISVRDTGDGISKENIECIFDPYFTTKEKGSGLGLASSYSIIKNHDGLITVESEQNVGTTFNIYLPASSNEITEKDALESKPVTGNGKILVMDDDEMVSNMVHTMLTAIGYTIESEKNGDKAIERYIKAKKEGVPFDLLLLDLTVQGGMGGKETIQKLHEIEPEAKAIVSSGYHNDSVLTDYADYGFRGAVTKPFNFEKLNKILQSVIGDNNNTVNTHKMK